MVRLPLEGIMKKDKYGGGVQVSRSQQLSTERGKLSCIFSFLEHAMHFFQVLQFLKSKEKPVDCILRHIDTSAIMDLVLRLSNNVEISELRLEVLQVSKLPMTITIKLHYVIEL